MTNEIIEKQRQAAKDHNLDVMVAISWENVAYTAGVLVPSQPKLRERHAICVVPVIGEPTMIIVDMEYSTVKKYGRIADVRSYKEFAENAMDHLGDVLTKLGLSQGRIGIEGKVISHDDFNHLNGRLPNAQFIGCDKVYAELRMVKTRKEIETISKVGRIADKVHTAIAKYAKAGMTERDVGAFATSQLILLGADCTSILVVAAGDRSGLPNVSPSDYELQPGDIMRIDILADLSAYHSDVARTYVIGQASNQQQEMWKKFTDTHHTVLENIRAGVHTQDLYGIYKKKFEDYGLPLANFLGHGLGITVHEEPYIGGISDYVLKEGMVLCVEPFLFGETEGYQLEDEILVTTNGYQLITDITPTARLVETA
ncbi:M24 family metallopeptidase [Chloroflexota bacterium]